jgi:hypothetical protein
MAGITLELSEDAALVLFDLPHRWEETHGLARPALDAAEQLAVWELSAALERSIREPFLPNYEGLVASALARLADGTEVRL